MKTTAKASVETWLLTLKLDCTYRLFGERLQLQTVAG